MKDRQATRPAAAPRVVVRAPNWIGDAVLALGGLREVRRVVGSAHLAVVARPWVAGLFEEAGVADEVVAVDRRSWRDALAAASRLRAGRYDLAVLFQNAFEAALVARLAGIPRVVGYPTDGRRLLLTDALPLARDHKSEHQSRYYMRVAAGLERALAGASSVDVSRPDLSLVASAASRARGAAILADVGLEPPVAILNPGATNSRAKRWLPERFAAVGDALAERFACGVALVGSEGDREVAERVRASMRARAEVLAGRTSIAELVGVLANAVALVSNDTGPAHLGAALGVPTVTVFGPTEEFATHPIGAAAVSVRRPVECSPCMLRDCPIDHRCMTGIGVDTVLDAVRDVTR